MLILLPLLLLDLGQRGDCDFTSPRNRFYGQVGPALGYAVPRRASALKFYCASNPIIENP
jgi:hypothetical protein